MKEFIKEFTNKEVIKESWNVFGMNQTLKAVSNNILYKYLGNNKSKFPIKIKEENILKARI